MISTGIPRISVIIPCRNERESIESSINSILSQEIEDYDTEILVADGMSDDGTKTILEDISIRNSRVRIIENPHKIVSTGLNAAICSATGEIIVRMDCHTEYAQDYIMQCVRALQTSGAENVGGPWQANGRTHVQKGIALAFHSAFASGGAGSHDKEFEGEVDSVYLGCWRKATLEKLGFFDEELVRNQDDELNLRIIRSGGKIWQTPKIKSWYYPRSSLKALFKQYMQYGYWKVRVIQKHRLPASFRHLVPGGFVGCLVLFGVLSPFFSWAIWIFLGLLCLYIVANIAASAVTCRKTENWRYFPVMPIVFSSYHFGYGYGFLRGFIDFYLFRKASKRKAFSEITRT